MKQTQKYVKSMMILSALVGSVAQAAFDDDLAKATSENVYEIQSSCNSAGQYTAKALEQTRNIRSVIEKLKNNAACKGLAESMDLAIKNMGESLQTVQQAQEDIKSSGGSIDQLNSVGDQMVALRTFGNSLNINSMNAPQANIPGLLPSSILSALSKTAMTSARLQSVSSGTPDIEANPKKSLTKALADKILGNKEKIKIAATNGLNILNSTMDTIQNAQASCLDAPSAAFVASGFTQMLAAMVSGGGTSLANKTAPTAINKIVNYVSRDKKYIQAIRQLNEAEFYTTLSCLIEMTSEGYCAAEDAQLLLSEVKKDFNIVKKTVEPTTAEKEAGGKTVEYFTAEAKNFQTMLEKGAMAGHYILAHQLPLVTDWITKIQMSNEPQLPMEAEFQTEAFNTGLGPFLQMKRILGEYNKKLAQLKNTSSLAGKQNLVLQMLFNVSDGFTAQNREVGENFFVRVHPAERMPFVLIGIKNYDDMPREVFVAANNQTMDPQRYISLYFQTKMPQFRDPDQLAITIKQNAQEIFEKAHYLAQQYFLQFFIPDQTAVVTESMVGMNKGDVRSALQEIDLYLKDFVERMSKPGGDPSFLPVAVDMRSRIGVVLAHYKRLREFGLKLVDKQQQALITEKKMQDEMSTMAKDFIQDVYDQFYIMTMRAGWLSFRLMMIIKKDYSLAMQQRSFSNQQMNDLMLATGLESLLQLFNQSGLNFGTAELDLAQARDLYVKNLNALELVSMAPMMNFINEHRLKADPNILTQRDLWNEANKYAYYLKAERGPIDNSNYDWVRKVEGAFNNVVEGLFGGFGLLNKDVKFGWPAGAQEILNSKLPDLTETTDGSSQKIWSRNCAVVLAFYDLQPYWYLCKKSTLYSAFYDKEKYAKNPSVLNFIEKYLSLNFTRSAYEGLDPRVNYANAPDKAAAKLALNKNRRARICALRDHYRRNYVMQITAGLKASSDVYTNEFSRIPERIVPKDQEQPVTPPSNGGQTGGDADVGGDTTGKDTGIDFSNMKPNKGNVHVPTSTKKDSKSNSSSHVAH